VLNLSEELFPSSHFPSMDSLDLLACAQRKTQSMYQAYEVRELIKIFDLNG
jgi:hypothetical protein